MITLTSLYIFLGLAMSGSGMTAFTLVRKKHHKNVS